MVAANNINNEALFKELKQTPLLAVPTFLCLVAGYVLMATAVYLCTVGGQPLWLGMLISTLGMYLLFSPAHDSMHRAMSSNDTLNEILLFLSVQPSAPSVTGRAFRVLHMQHHRFANDVDMDPDHHVAENWKFAFSLWFIWDYLYIGYFFKHRLDLPEQARKQFYIDLTLNVIGVLALWIFLPWQLVLMLWFIPARLSLWLICLTFMVLPHYPHDTPHSVNPYRATSIRQGMEWLMSPLLACQNYHLVHHLYPTIPFYRYRRAWLARKDMHEANNPAIVHPFGLRPYT